MKFVFFLFVCFFSFYASAQSLKKKVLGVYQGEIPGYVIDLGEETVTVLASSLRIELLSDGTCTEQIGMETRKGTYVIAQEQKAFYVLTITLEGQYITEEMQVNKKGKTAIRTGIFPQPEALLVRAN